MVGLVLEYMREEAPCPDLHGFAVLIETYEHHAFGAGNITPFSRNAQASFFNTATSPLLFSIFGLMRA